MFHEVLVVNVVLFIMICMKNINFSYQCLLPIQAWYSWNKYKLRPPLKDLRWLFIGNCYVEKNTYFGRSVQLLLPSSSSHPWPEPWSSSSEGFHETCVFVWEQILASCVSVLEQIHASFVAVRDQVCDWCGAFWEQIPESCAFAWKCHRVGVLA